MAKDFNDIACFFCGKRNDISDHTCTQCLKPLHIENQFIGKTVQQLTITEYKARGFYGLTYKACDASEKTVALKLISKAAYIDQEKDFMDEAKAYAKLPNHPSIAQYIAAGETRITLLDEEVGFYFILSEWIPGPTFREWIRSEERLPRDIYYASVDLLTALQAFEEVYLWHNDLHEENILVLGLTESQRRSLRRTEPYLLKVVDIGSAKFRSSDSIKPINDLNYIGRHITEALAHIIRHLDRFTREDQEFLLTLRNFCVRLTDENPTRGFHSASDALDTLEFLWHNSRQPSIQGEQHLSDPYGLINATDIPPMMIREMFSEKFKYFERIESADNHAVLVTGPRGCGKTMILRRMSFECVLSDAKKGVPRSLKESKYIGLFISARMDFGNLLIAERETQWIKNPELVRLYFNILVTLRIIDLIQVLVREKMITEESVTGVIDFIEKRFHLPLSNIYTIRSYLLHITQQIILDAQRSIDILDALNGTPEYLNNIFIKLRGTISCIRDKALIILLDDFSWPRIPDIVMSALLPFLFNAGAPYKTRVTAHTDALLLTSNAGEKYEENRDFIQINLGKEYYLLSEDYQTCVEGFDDIMTRRFRLAQRNVFPGIAVILGKGEELRDLGSFIKRLAKEKKLRSLRYQGSHVFVKLCSGDLSYSLDMLGQMSLRWGEKELPINLGVQHDVIRTFARGQLQSLRDLKSRHVHSLHQTAMAFGRMSRAKLLISGAEHLRIEVEHADLTPKLWDAMKELLSYGIFIDGGYSNNSRGIPVRRLLFRRIYTPAFPTTVNNRNTFAMNKSQFSHFIVAPMAYAETVMSASGLSPEYQNQLESLEYVDENF